MNAEIVAPKNIAEIKECVYKLFYGDKYIVVMAKSIYRSVWSINDDLTRYYTGVKETVKEGLYGKFCKHIVDNPGETFSFEMILVTDNAYELLKQCQLELYKGENDVNCLNTSFTPYINKDLQKPANKRKTHWWINRGTYLNFCNWKRKNPINNKNKEQEPAMNAYQD